MTHSQTFTPESTTEYQSDIKWSSYWYSVSACLLVCGLLWDNNSVLFSLTTRNMWKVRLSFFYTIIMVLYFSVIYFFYLSILQNKNLTFLTVAFSRQQYFMCLKLQSMSKTEQPSPHTGLYCVLTVQDCTNSASLAGTWKVMSLSAICNVTSAWLSTSFVVDTLRTALGADSRRPSKSSNLYERV